ncbi:MAG TPA: TetR/AcrR family transcriptional regulator [Thermoanaerobaculia bacterium]|nr:TetR/AcrR family transcriptional regulator [Thermoanaerobaculia bacterium]
MPKQIDSAAAPRVPLNRERVLHAAVRLVEEDGIEALTMRDLARALGVEAMSLYNHVANKGDLMDAIVDLVIGEIELPSGAEDWQVAIRHYAISAHRVLLQHPWACSLAISPTSTPAPGATRLRHMEWLLARLREAGFSPELAYHAYHALDSHVLGFTLWQLGHAAAAKSLGDASDRATFVASFLRELRAGDYPYLAEHVQQHLSAPSGDGEREFQFGLDLILDGLEKARTSA